MLLEWLWQFVCRAARLGLSLLRPTDRQEVPPLRSDTGVAFEAAAISRRAPSKEAITRPHHHGPDLLDETWLKVVSFFTPVELCRAGRADWKLHSIANDEEIWRSLCNERWQGKQLMPPTELFKNGDYSGLHLSVAECKSLLRQRDVNIHNVTEKSELLQALCESNPHIPGCRRGQANAIPCKWKRSYALAEIDSKREYITVDEVSHYRWQLIYHGRPSTMGLRHFQKNGVFISPHFGETQWSLPHGGRWFAMQGLDPLKVTRNHENWGWILGSRTSTEYHSFETPNT